ncbi:MAG: DUF4365 domain-containing protein [Opitutales bacterium]|nr:DUF4365 domain-containing protein [Opitutales bacterium]
MARYNETERIGVNAIEQIILKEFGWIFREQPVVDMGIDAHIEKTENGDPKGKLIAVQIKSGSSHFKDKEESLTFYGKLEHLEYWRGHSLPVIIVAYIPEQNIAYWEAIEESKIITTKTSWKIDIPKKNVLGLETKVKLEEYFKGSLQQQKLRQLAIDEPLMRHIKNGGKVSLELENWVNKSLGRTPVKVYIHDESGNEILEQEWFQIYTGYTIEELARVLFPWADVFVDEEFFENNQDIYPDWNHDYYSEIPKQRRRIYPYSESSGEVELYRLELVLNEVGKSFLVLSEYLNKK